MKDLQKNNPEYKPRLQPSRGTGENAPPERTDKEQFEKELKDNASEELNKKVDLRNPSFDPDIPEQKQRWHR